MAITKYKVIKKNLDAVINYAMNGEKTENGILVSAINCMPQTAYSQMMLTKKAFHKEGGRLGYHIIQSFNGNEISPDKCNKTEHLEKITLLIILKLEYIKALYMINI